MRTQSAKRHEPSIFDPNISGDELEAMSMPVARQEVGMELPKKIPHRRRFFFDTGRRIGASEGSFTNYIVVEYISTGSVHAFPASEQWLKEKGADL